MRWLVLNSSASRAMAIAFTGLILVLTWLLMIQPIAEWRSDALRNLDQIRAEQQRLIQVRSELARKIDLSDTQQSEGMFWVTDNIGQLYAQIQTDLIEAANVQGFNFSSITPLPARHVDQIDLAVVRLEFESDLSQLAGFLREIEYAVPTLSVESASLRRLFGNDDQNEQPLLLSQIEIAGPYIDAGKQ